MSSTTERKNITMKDVAHRAGVHLSSVSVVLNGSRSSAGISEINRQRIVDAAAELGYRRNGSAHTIRTGKCGNIALLLSPLRSHSYLPMQLLAGLHDSLDEADMSLTFCLLEDEELGQGDVLPKFLRERMCDGLLVDYNLRIPRSILESIRHHQIPAVWLNSRQEADCVYPDDFDAAQRATRHLLELGHERIVYANFASKPDELHYSSTDRCEGYRAAMRAANLETREWGLEMAGPDSVEKCARELGAPDRPTAIVGYATYAFEGVSYAAACLGMRVPDDLSVVTFGPEPTEYMCRPLTLMLEPQTQMGRLATRMIQRKIEYPDQMLAPNAVPFGWAPGQSSAARTGAERELRE